MIYNFFKKILFKLPPETAHHVTLQLLQFAHRFHLIKNHLPSYDPKTVMGLEFRNPIGLAAGLDKNGEYIDALAALGFGFIEIGTVTPKLQVGNPKPRLFRLIEQEAIINRMGFNSKGVEYVVNQLKKTNYRGILGVNIGKNRDTSIENAVSDYQFCFKQLAPYASYITINISSPNTENLRALQHGMFLQTLLQTLKLEQKKLFISTKKFVPVVVKVAPDLTLDEIQMMCEIFIAEKIDGIIATNTTVTRTGLEHLPLAKEKGGLSGAPLRQLSTQVIEQFYRILSDRIPIIGCGGVASSQDVTDKLSVGAKLIQIYSALIYQGSGLLSILSRYQ